MKILLATGNRHKVEEISAILRGSADIPRSTEFVSLADFPELPPVEEDGKTLEQNAVKKAVTAALGTRLWALADDTGLEVEALDGAPGVYSARYAGPDCDFKANCDKLLAEMKGEKNRRAVFRCVVALASPEGQVRIRVGSLEGRITESPFGEKGFGYDPVFLVPERDKTLAEMTADEKNSISHRWEAVRAVAPWIREVGVGVG
jgi:XTP/dITP diphosphohydrolase